MAKREDLTQRTRHLHTKHHHFKENLGDDGKGGSVSIEYISTDRQIADLLTKGLGESAFPPVRDLLMGWTPRKLLDHKGELKESDVRPREIPSPKDSVFLANVRSHKKVFHVD